jgi:septal ring factor EnvC (AmiA/AmiB activator)
MVNDPQELILEHLRAIRGDIAEIKTDIRDLKAGMNALRTELNSLRGDVLRQERSIAAVEVDVDRINARLGLSDMPQ